MNNFCDKQDTENGIVTYHRGLLLWSLLLLGLVMIIYIAMSAGAETLPPANGDWNVNDRTVIENQTVDLNGSLFVNNGGHLTLRNVTLTINCTYNGEFNITVRNGSSLICTDLDLDKRSTADTTIIRSNASAGNHRYGFRAENGSTLVMTGTKITNCGWEDLGGNRGVTVMCDNSVIMESIFTGNYMGIIYNGTNGGSLSNSNISGNSLNGAYLLNTTGTTIERCNISGSNGHGVNLYLSNNNYIKLNKISGFFYNQVFWPSYNGSAVLLDNSDYNTVDRNDVDSPRARGIWLRSANYNVISNNYLEGNTYTNTMVSFGIGLLKSHYNSIHHNELNHHFMSIYINYFSHYNRVENNLIDQTIRGLSLGDPIYGLWDAYKGHCDYNYFGNNSVNNSEFHGFIIIEGSSFNYIYNTTFTDAQQRTQSGTKFGFLVDHSDNNTFEDNHFYNNSLFSVGIGLQSSSDCQIINNTIGADGFNQEAINLYGDCNRNIIANNTIHHREWTISIGSSSNFNIIRNNSVYDSDYGIWIWTGSNDNRIYGNSVNNTTSPGISITYWSGSGAMERNTVENNTVWDCPVGIHSDSTSRNFTVMNNTIYNCTTGILVEGRWGHQILGAKIYQCQEGIRFANIMNSSVNGSVIFNCQKAAINITQCDKTAVLNSTFYSNPTVLLIRNTTNLTIDRNDFHDNIISIDHDELSDTRFLMNDIHHQDIGLMLDASGNLTVENNSFHSNAVGVSYHGRNRPFKNNVFFENTVGISYEGGVGAIANNTFHNNTNGISFMEEGGNVEYCELRDNVHGLHFSAAGRAGITGCNIMRNNYGIYAEYVQGILLDQCTIRDNIGYGVYSAHEAGVTVRDSRLASNGGWGIFCIMDGRVEIEAMNNASIENEDFFISGYITVYDGGSLWVNGSHVRIAGADGHYYRVELGSGGFLSLRNSTVSSGNNQPYYFFARRNSALEMRDSSVTGCGIRTRNEPNEGWGVTLDNCSAILVRSSFRDTPCGIFIRDCNLVLSEISFSETEHWAYINSSRVIFNKCTFAPSQSANEFIKFYDSQAFLENCSLPQSGFTMSAENNAWVILTDIALDSNLIRTDISSTVIVRYGYIFHFVDPDGNPVPGISYYVTDGKGQVVYSGISNDTASSGTMYLVAYWAILGGVDRDYNPHVMTVEVDSPNGYQMHEFNVDGKGDLTITVNFYPQIDFSRDIEVLEGGNLSGEFNLNDWFSDQGNLDYLCTNQGNLSVTIHPNGSVDIHILDPDWYGVQRIIFTATNRFDLSSIIITNVTVIPVDDAPVISPMENVTIEPDDTIKLNLTLLISDVDTPFGLLNITIEPGLFHIYNNNLVLPYHEIAEPVLLSIYVTDNSSTVNTSFWVFFKIYQEPVFYPLPNTTVEIDTLYVINLSLYFNLSKDDLSNLTVSTDSEYITVEGHLLSLTYPEIQFFEKVFVQYTINERVFIRILNVTVTGHPVFGNLPDITVTSGIMSQMDLNDYFELTPNDKGRLNISVISQYVTVEGFMLNLLFPEGVGFERVVVNFGLGINLYVRTINVTIEDLNHPPVVIGDSVVNVGLNYTFTLYGSDEDGQELFVKLILKGNATLMHQVEGTPRTFRISLNLVPGDYSYYYSLDDGSNETNSMFNTTTKWLEVRGEEDIEGEEGVQTEFFESWPSTLLIIILVIATLLLLIFILKGKKRPPEEPDHEAMEDEPESEIEEKEIIPEPQVVVRTEGLEAQHQPDPEIYTIPVPPMTDTAVSPPVVFSTPPAQKAPKPIDSVKSLKWLEKGMRFAVRGGHAKAEKSFERAISFDPYDPNPWYQKCLLLQDTGNIEKAEECMGKLMELMPELSEYARESVCPPPDSSLPPPEGMGMVMGEIKPAPVPVSADPPMNNNFSEPLPPPDQAVTLPESDENPLQDELQSPDQLGSPPETSGNPLKEELSPPVDTHVPSPEEALPQQDPGAGMETDARGIETKLDRPSDGLDKIVEEKLGPPGAEPAIVAKAIVPDTAVEENVITAEEILEPDHSTENPETSILEKTGEIDQDEELETLLSELNV